MGGNGGGANGVYGDSPYSNGVNASANLGCGGGGASGNSSGTGGNGSSGVVIIRYQFQ